MPFVVQFPHPGREHRPSPPEVGTVMPWNRDLHGRKFLRSRAQYLDRTGHHAGEVAFWGEWEAQSRVLDVWAKEGSKPRFLHEPFHEAPPDGLDHQNIDPFVFGDSFLYTNCKQLNNSKLRRLTLGSLVLFGSGTGQGFVLDTVFVVGDDPLLPYEVGERDVLPDRPETDPLIFRPLSTSTQHLGMGCVVVRSRPYEAADERPFSFVPCRSRDAQDVRFPRPLLEPVGPLQGLVNPKLFMGTRVTEVEAEVVAAAWRHVRAVVEAQELALAVRLAVPPPAVNRLQQAAATGRTC